MTIDEAVQLALDIQTKHPQTIVVAIGRFAMIEELVTKGDELPWGVSVVARDRPQQRATLFTPEHWAMFQDLASNTAAGLTRVRKHVTPVSASATPPETKGGTSAQLSLF